MCVDANAAARNAARQRWMEKDAKYRSESLKYWNRETSAVRGMQRAATGYSRAISNDYQRALYVQGQARKAYQAGFIKYQQTKGSVNEGGRDRRSTKKGLVALTRARGQLDNAVQKVLNDGLRTKDILSKGKKEVSTTQMGDAIISKLK